MYMDRGAVGHLRSTVRLSHTGDSTEPAHMGGGNRQCQPESFVSLSLFLTLSHSTRGERVVVHAETTSKKKKKKKNTMPNITAPVPVVCPSVCTLRSLPRALKCSELLPHALSLSATSQQFGLLSVRPCSGPSVTKQHEKRKKKKKKNFHR